MIIPINHITNYIYYELKEQNINKYIETLADFHKRDQLNWSLLWKSASDSIYLK
jgi:hypothetical protein